MNSFFRPWRSYCENEDRGFANSVSRFATAGDIAAALGGKKAGAGWMVKCVCHDDRTPSLKLDDGGNGRVLVKCFAGCDQTAIIEALQALGLWHSNTSNPNPVHASASEKHERVLKIWQIANDARSSCVETYLRARGISIPVPDALRYLGNCWHSEAGTEFPAMVAAVRCWPSENVIAVQRTYLRSDGSGKAAVSPAKKSLGATKGGAIRLAPVGHWLGLAEGIEDALSVMQANPDLPCWAVLGVAGLQSVILPPLPLARDVVILADRDAVGEHAAQCAAKRFIREGRVVRVAFPPGEAKDFNAALRAAVRR